MSFAQFLTTLDNHDQSSTAETENNCGVKLQGLYGKDLDCPPEWIEELQSLIPPCTFYLSPSGDLMSSLPPSARAENMMIYIGNEGTYTPAHKDMCATLGQNIMVHASDDKQNPGSSLWFIMSSNDREKVADYWLSHLGQNLETESYFASIDDLKNAPFTVFVYEQKLGDFILIPPLAPHQVWNRGNITIKASWSRSTVDTLQLAISESCPNSRLVCRDEQYKNKAIIHETLKIYASMYLDGRSTLEDFDASRFNNDFVRLFALYESILVDECFSPARDIPDITRIDTEYGVTCSFCRANIWNRFLTCKNCALPDSEEDEHYDVCMDCYARGRSCSCISNYVWVEQYDWEELQREHERFMGIVLSITGTTETSSASLGGRVEKLGRKTLAHVCQEQLDLRPWATHAKKRIKNDDSQPKSKQEGNSVRCHVCKTRHPLWKAMCCNECAKAYCYGNLWRAYEMDPFIDVLCRYSWKCPACRGICSCGACRNKGTTNPYIPKCKYPGFSIKKFVDPRSRDNFLNLSRGNQQWVKGKESQATINNHQRTTTPSPPDDTIIRVSAGSPQPDAGASQMPPPLHQLEAIKRKRAEDANINTGAIKKPLTHKI